MTAAAQPVTAPRVAVVGGGLAGLAAAVALASAQLRVELFEARRRLGGRAGSFRDPDSGETVDHCQHVSMGCCTALADFCRRVGSEDAFRRDRVLTFFGPNGRASRFKGAAWLPVPLHLGPSLLRLRFLSLRERLGVARALWKLARLKDVPDETVASWLRQQGQSPRAVELFWEVVLQSALGESVEHAALRYARKVFVDGFMASRRGYEVLVPRVPLGELYGRRLEEWLAEHNVTLHLNTAVRRLCGTPERIEGVESTDGAEHACDACVVALPWRRVAELFEPKLAAAAGLPECGRIEPSPITGVHLWFDRPLTDLPHAVLVGRLSQWLFNHGQRPAVGENAGDEKSDTNADAYYVQVVISASRSIGGRPQRHVVEEVCRDLRSVFPPAREARLLQWRLVTDPHAVFSVRPGIDRLRPPQQTGIANLALAGDWTATGWPATMEGAVRSGYAAADALLAHLGRDERFSVPELPRGPLARWLLPR